MPQFAKRRSSASKYRPFNLCRAATSFADVGWSREWSAISTTTEIASISLREMNDNVESADLERAIFAPQHRQARRIAHFNP
jgi:hypothetical protein